MSEKKKSNGIQLLIRAVVTDPDGKVLSDTGQKPSKSFVIQLLQWIGFKFDEPTRFNYAKDVAGANTIIHDNQNNGGLRVNAGINVSLYGIVVGSSNTAKSNTDWKLISQLTEGAGAGQITHNATTIGTVAIVAGNVELEIKRSFTNNTGALRTVKEAGIYVWGYQGYSGANQYHCIIRDILVAAIDVPDKCSLTVYYYYRTTV